VTACAREQGSSGEKSPSPVPDVIPAPEAHFTAFAYHAPPLTSANRVCASEAGLPVALQSIVTICALVQALFGENAVAEVPFVMPFSAAHATASA
jgi:hypothetical protein